MDERLPLGPPDAATLRMLLEKEHAHWTELEQERSRLQTGLGRQNAVIVQLERRDAARTRRLAELETLAGAITEQNSLLRQQVAALQQENARLRGVPLAPAPDPAPDVKPAVPRREPTVRKKRAAEHNRGRLKLERATRWETHGAEACPQCGEHLAGGWVVRRVQVIDLAPVAPLEVTEHRILRRQCPRCGRRVLPQSVGLVTGRIGRCRFGPRLIAALATMRVVERLPIRVIQERLTREYGLVISQGGIVGLLQRMAAAGQATYVQIGQDVRAGSVIHADETGWRENGQHTTVWTVSTSQQVYFAHGRRTNEAIDTILGADFAGTIVADCYAAYDHFEGPKQRCWAHLVRDLEALLHEQEGHPETVAWGEGILAVYQQATAARPAAEEGATPQAARAREARARRYEALILLLCPAELDPVPPYATLAKRLRRYLPELFTFVRDPRVDATNNAAERSLRPVVTIRKISGGTRSQTGSMTCMILASIAATARIQGENPTAVYHDLLLTPPGTPSPLAMPATEDRLPLTHSHAS